MDMSPTETPPDETPIMDRTAFLDYCKTHKVDPVNRLLLLSDGTLVEHLEALYQMPVRLRLQHQREVPMPDADADWLGVPRACPTLERHAFLRADGAEGGNITTNRVAGKGGSAPSERIVLFAASLFPCSSLPSALREEIVRGHLPVGKLIRDLPTRRDRLEVAYRPVPLLAEALGLSPARCFWTRRYRLTLVSCGPGVIFEAFPPREILR